MGRVLIPDPLVDIACYSEPMDLGSVLVRGSGSSIEVDGTAPPDPRSKWLAPKLIAILDLGLVVITGLRHMQPGREEQLIPDPL